MQLSLRQSLTSVAGRIFDLAWSPRGTGHILSGSDDHDAVELWSTAGSGPPCRTLKFALPSAKVSSSARKPSWVQAGHGHAAVSPACLRCAWHPDAHFFLTGSDDGHVAVWSAHDGECRSSLSVSKSTEEEGSEEAP